MVSAIWPLEIFHCTLKSLILKEFLEITFYLHDTNFVWPNQKGFPKISVSLTVGRKKNAAAQGPREGNERKGVNHQISSNLSVSRK